MKVTKKKILVAAMVAALFTVPSNASAQKLFNYLNKAAKEQKEKDKKDKKESTDAETFGKALNAIGKEAAHKTDSLVRKNARDNAAALGGALEEAGKQAACKADSAVRANTRDEADALGNVFNTLNDLSKAAAKADSAADKLRSIDRNDVNGALDAMGKAALEHVGEEVQKKTNVDVNAVGNALETLGKLKSGEAQLPGADLTNVDASAIGGVLGALAAGAAASSVNKDGTAFSADGIVSGLLGSVLDSFAPNKLESIVGTWNFKGSSFLFESENALASLGSEVMATKIEEQVDRHLAKMNITEGNCDITFKEDSTCVFNVGGKKLYGNYSLNNETHELEFSYVGLMKQKAYLVYDKGMINIVYQSNGLLNMLKSMSQKTAKGSWALLNTLLGEYDGLRIGMAYSK